MGNFSSYQIDSVNLESKALSWDEESSVVWQKVGAECIVDRMGKTPLNYGQIAKAYLLNRENNGDFQFTFKGKDVSTPGRVRRQKRRLCSGVSAPVDKSAKMAKLFMEKKVESGEIDIGENVVEKIIQQRRFDKTSGQLVTTSFTVHARKHPLHTLRLKLFHKYKMFMRLNPNSYFEDISMEELINRFQHIGESIDVTEDVCVLKDRLKHFERTRCLQVWHDGSCITNHGHILFCVNILYDRAVFYTSSEYEEKFKIRKDIQSIVETPELYLIGRCASNDEQL